jgi:hypothetical protein
MNGGTPGMTGAAPGGVIDSVFPAVLNVAV